MTERELPFQKAILNKELPYTIGGGYRTVPREICNVSSVVKHTFVRQVMSSLWPTGDQQMLQGHHGDQLLENSLPIYL